MHLLNARKQTMIKEIELNDVSSIISVFRDVSGVDFSNYAPSSLKRRFIRFMELKKVTDTRELLSLTKTNQQFAQEFLNEVTVNVTEMFRDPDFWKGIKQLVLPALAEKETIRIWHAACSSGEEVFSMAILLKEYGILDKAEILGTDINMQALDHANLGIQSKKKFHLSNQNYKDLKTQNLLSDYFDIEKNHNTLKKDIMKHIYFKRNDLVSGGSASKFDLILCRNVFIYFNRNLQEKVLHMFSGCLNKDGFLGIGSKESIAWCRSERFFEILSAEEKIFRKRSFNY